MKPQPKEPVDPPHGNDSLQGTAKSERHGAKGALNLAFLDPRKAAFHMLRDLPEVIVRLPSARRVVCGFKFSVSGLYRAAALRGTHMENASIRDFKEKHSLPSNSGIKAANRKAIACHQTLGSKLQIGKQGAMQPHGHAGHTFQKSGPATWNPFHAAWQPFLTLPLWLSRLWMPPVTL